MKRKLEEGETKSAPLIGQTAYLATDNPANDVGKQLKDISVEASFGELFKSAGNSSSVLEERLSSTDQYFSSRVFPPLTNFHSPKKIPHSSSNLSISDAFQHLSPGTLTSAKDSGQLPSRTSAPAFSPSRSPRTYLSEQALM
jgi:hypothetical protein